MPTFTLETPRGKRLTIESDSPENAMRLADQWDLEDHAASEAQRLGVNPDLILRQMQKESGGNARAVSPKGARGPMQLMPGTAKDLGVDPDDPYQNITGGVTYYRQQLDRYGGDERRALAAYNAGPGAVDKYGGVPPYAETEDYVSTLAGKASPAATPMATAPAMPRRAAAPAPQVPQRADQALGFMKGLMKPLDNAATGLEYAADKIGLDEPINALNAALGLPSTKQAVQSRKDYVADQATKGVRPGKIGEFAGNITGTLPVALATRNPALAGGISGGLLSEAQSPLGVLADMGIGAVSGKVADKAIGAAGEGLKRLIGPAIPKPAEIAALKDAAYKTVENLGVKYKPGPFKGLIASLDMEAKAADYSALLHPRITAVLEKVGSLKGKSPTFTEVEQLRRFIQRNAVVSKSANEEEQRIGRILLGQVDDFIQTMGPKQVTSGNPKAAAEAVVKARDLARRDFAISDVVKGIEAAKDRIPTSGVGGNTDNVIRQEMRKVLQNAKGLKPAERAALEKAVRGNITQDSLRLLGRLSPTTGGLSAMLHTGAAGLSGGATLPFAIGGFLSKAGADQMTKKNVQEVIRTIAAPLAKGTTPQQALMLELLKKTMGVARPLGIGGAASTATSGAAYARTPTVQRQKQGR